VSQCDHFIQLLLWSHVFADFFFLQSTALYLMHSHVFSNRNGFSKLGSTGTWEGAEFPIWRSGLLRALPPPQLLLAPQVLLWTLWNWTVCSHVCVADWVFSELWLIPESRALMGHVGSFPLMQLHQQFFSEKVFPPVPGPWGDCFPTELQPITVFTFLFY
jgi:hypothetical protein